MWFEASRFERLGRRIAAAPRALLLGLAALTAALSPGVIRVDPGPAPASVDPRGETALFELACDAGVWSVECLAAVESLTRSLSSRTDLVAQVDSLTTRPRVVQEGGGLALRPLVEAVPVDATAVRRLHARAGSDRAAFRGLIAANERAAAVTVRFSAGARPSDVHALVESLRRELHRPPAVELAVASAAHRAVELERVARADLRRVTAAALIGLALLGVLAFGSVPAGVGVTALAAAALVWCAAGIAASRAALGNAAAIVPVLACAGAAVTALALSHRTRSERRAGRTHGEAVARALGGAGAPLAAAGLCGAAALGSLAIVTPARAFGLAGAGGFAAAVSLVALGLPAAQLARGGRTPPASAGLRHGRSLEGALARLDGALRARPASHWPRVLVSLGALALALLGVRQLRGDASATHSLPASAPARADLELLSRDFGGASLVRIRVDAGVPDGAADPLFLEHVVELERFAASLQIVGAVRSLVDAAVLPAMRASHDDDPGFAVVPPTREVAAQAYDLFAREAPQTLADGLDADRRRLALDLFVDARDSRAVGGLRDELEGYAAHLFGRRGALEFVSDAFGESQASERLLRTSLLAALAGLAATAVVAGLAFESGLGGCLAAAPAALAMLFALGAMGPLGVALDDTTPLLLAVVAAVVAAPALSYLARVRELGGAGAELHVAVSIALRDVGRPIAECAFASVLFLTLSASGSPPLRTFGVLACASLLVATAAVLVVLPLAIRTLRPNFLIARTENASGETHSCVRDARNGGGG